MHYNTHSTPQNAKKYSIPKGYHTKPAKNPENLKTQTGFKSKFASSTQIADPTTHTPKFNQNSNEKSPKKAKSQAQIIEIYKKGENEQNLTFMSSEREGDIWDGEFLGSKIGTQIFQ